MPYRSAQKGIKVLLRGGPVAVLRVIDAPWEHDIGRRARRFGKDRSHYIGNPVDDGHDAMTRRREDWD
jgi:hypothetical protein